MEKRDFLKFAVFGSLWPALPSIASFVDEVKMVDPESPQAKALGYVHHYSEVDGTQFPRYTEGQICANCQLAQGNTEDDWFGCSLFPNQLVSREGWCSAWVERR